MNRHSHLPLMSMRDCRDANAALRFSPRKHNFELKKWWDSEGTVFFAINVGRNGHMHALVACFSRLTYVQEERK